MQTRHSIDSSVLENEPPRRDGPIAQLARDLWYTHHPDTEVTRTRIIERVFPSGEREVVAQRVVDRPFDALRRVGWDLQADRPAPTDDDIAAHRARAARRARQRVRHAVKAIGADTLWTFTYRENVTDRGRLLRDWAALRKRIARVLPGWSWVTVAERQTRGAWHLHVATHALPRTITYTGLDRQRYTVRSFDFIRRAWRDIIGGGGSFNQRTRQHGRGAKSTARLARYLSKYVGKEFDSDGLDAGTQRYWLSRGQPRPASRTWWLDGAEAMRDVLGVVWSMIGGDDAWPIWMPDRDCLFVEVGPPD